MTAGGFTFKMKPRKNENNEGEELKLFVRSYVKFTFSLGNRTTQASLLCSVFSRNRKKEITPKAILLVDHLLIVSFFYYVLYYAGAH